MNEVGFSPRAFLDATGLRAFEIGADEVPRLQRFFDANPAYFVAVTGEPAGASEAHDEVTGEPPAGWSYTKKWVVGFAGEGGELVAMVNVVADLLADGVWHIGLFIVATRAHGDGTAQRLLRRIERWAVAEGARWLRLGVAEGNGRAERFWAKSGFVEVRKRAGIAMGRRVNSVRVMVKSLAGGSLPEYLELIARDDPQAP